MSNNSRVWFTAAGGILTEIFYPDPDCACVQQLELFAIGLDGSHWSEHEAPEKQSDWSDPGVPCFQQTNRFPEFQITKRICSDPARSVVLVHVQFMPERDDLRLFVNLRPRISEETGNKARAGDWNGVPFLFASGQSRAAALGSTAGWLSRSGDVSDVLSSDSGEIGGDPVELTGELDWKPCRGEFVLAIGFGERAEAAAHHVRASLLGGYFEIEKRFREGWRSELKTLCDLDTESSDGGLLYRNSTSVILTHTAKTFPGAIVASLAVPWGPSKRKDHAGGYHLVWTRDMIQAVGSLLACGAHERMRQTLCYLAATQLAPGYWAQNMNVDGVPYFTGIQLDETGFPILLAEAAFRRGALADADLNHLWPCLRKAAWYIVNHGPATPQDRWEHNSGYSPFSIAVEITALLAAAELAEVVSEQELADNFRAVADNWNGKIESWVYVTGTQLAKQHGVDGYYLWIRPAECGAPLSDDDKKRRELATDETVSPDSLALVRFGLRSPHDPRILNTIKIIDATLRNELPGGPCWRRYNGDKYGEHDDGAPFDKEGVGRVWPLLTGERAHYEIAAGNFAEAKRLAGAMEVFAGSDGLLSEQLWNAPDLPEHVLYFGRPTRSARPLVWAHAEYVKLLRSLKEGAVHDTPPFAKARYVKD